MEVVVVPQLKNHFHIVRVSMGCITLHIFKLILCLCDVMDLFGSEYFKFLNICFRVMSAQPSGLFGHQHEPERFASAVSHIESKATDVKTNIEQLLFMLDLQEKVEW